MAAIGGLDLPGNCSWQERRSCHSRRIWLSGMNTGIGVISSDMVGGNHVLAGLHLVGEVIQFPFWRRQDQVAAFLVAEKGGDLCGFMVQGTKTTEYVPTRASALRAAYRAQQSGTNVVEIFFRKAEDEEYEPVITVDLPINESDLPMEESLDD